MSKAGQNTSSGIAKQTDVALLFMLESYQVSNFDKMIVEGTGWEDFTLVFSDKTISFEVKWHERPLSYSDVRAILKKELKKIGGNDYQFKIVAKKFSPSLVKDANNLKKSLRYWNLFTKNSKITDYPIVKRFLTKGWSQNEIILLLKTDLIPIVSEDKLKGAIYEHFTYKNHVFLNQHDLELLTSSCFGKILGEASKGGVITKHGFQEIVSAFEKELATKSESFTPEISVGKRVQNLDELLLDSTTLAQLSAPKYLTPLTAESNRRLVFYLASKLEDEKFSVADIDFFLENVLIKNSYILTCFGLLRTKWKQNKLTGERLIQFLFKHYDKLSLDYFIHDALEMLLTAIKQDSTLAKKVVPLLKIKILPSLRPDDDLGNSVERDFSYKFAHLVPILVEVGKAMEQGQDFIDLLFEYFDFTGDSYALVVETPAELYRILSDYLFADIDKNWSIVLGRITNQYVKKYGALYKGSELAGGGTFQQGHSFTFTDIGLVRFIYAPLFSNLLQKDSESFCKILKKHVLIYPASGASRRYPMFLKRAAISSLLTLVRDSATSAVLRDFSKKELLKILQIKRGIPITSEAIFSLIESQDIVALGAPFVLKLIKTDSSQHSKWKFPTNIFALKVLSELVDNGDKSSEKFLIELARNPQFRKQRLFDEFLALLGNNSILQNQAAVRLKFIKACELKTQLKDVASSRWISSDFLKNLLIDLWKQDNQEAKDFIEYLISDDEPSEGLLNLLSNALFQQSDTYSEQIIDIFWPYIAEPKKYWAKFSRSSQFRVTLVRLAETLIKKGDIEKAKHIIELEMTDPDPNTDEVDNFNYHSKLKRGEHVMVISGVRSQVAWVLQRLVAQNNAKSIEYALGKTIELLDLNGELAKRLGYSTTDLYVTSQAMVPLIEISHPYRRKLLEDYQVGLGEQVKTVAMDLFRFIKNQFDRDDSQPKELLEKVVLIFSYVRDLSTEEAEEVLSLFESHAIEESVFLFIYFAVYRMTQYTQIPFDPAPFDERLKRLCSTQNPLKKKLAWNFWRTLNDKESTREDWLRIEGYWKLLFDSYDAGVFGMLSLTLENSLADSALYSEHFELLKTAIRVESTALQKEPAHPRISLRKSGDIIREKSTTDFLDLLDMVIALSNPLTGEGIYSSVLYELVKSFKSLSTRDENLKARAEKIKKSLNEMGHQIT